MDKKEEISRFNKRNNLILVIIFIVVVLIVGLITYFQNSNNLTEKDFKCISEKSELYVSRTCSHCADQEKLLGNYLSYFNITDCLDNIKVCANLEINQVPTWVINNQTYVGVKTLNELKKLAGC